VKELTRITQLLAEYHVDFVVAGGLGTLLHGSALMTRDVDVACCMDPDNLLRLFHALETLRPVHRMTLEKLPFTKEQAERRDLNNLHLSTDWGQLDCLGDIKGIGGEGALEKLPEFAKGRESPARCHASRRRWSRMHSESRRGGKARREIRSRSSSAHSQLFRRGKETAKYRSRAGR